MFKKAFIEKRARRGHRLAHALGLWALLLVSVSAHAQDGGAGGDGGAASRHPDRPVKLAENAPARVSSVEVAVKILPTEVIRGSVVRLEGANLPTKPEDTLVWLDDVEVGSPVLAERDALEFIVPHEGILDGQPRPLAARRYVLSFASKAKGASTYGPRISVGVLRVVPEKLPPLRLDNLSPTIVYPAPPADAQSTDTVTPPSMVVTGDGFGGRLRDYRWSTAPSASFVPGKRRSRAKKTRCAWAMMTAAAASRPASSPITNSSCTGPSWQPTESRSRAITCLGCARGMPPAAER